MSARREAELAVIADVLVAPKALPRLIVDEGIGSQHFSDPQLRDVFAAMLRLNDQGAGIDAITVAREAKMHPRDVDALAAASGNTVNVREHARTVLRFALRRSWHDAGQLLQQAAADDNEQLVAQAEQALARPTVSDDTYSPTRLADEVGNYLDDQTPAGITTGFPPLDGIIGGGFRPGDTTVVMAWESMGKSALAMQWLADAKGAGLKAHAYINDMSARDCALRMVSQQGAVPWGALAAKKLTDNDRRRVLKALNTLPFGVTDAAQWSAEQVGRHLRINRWDIAALDVLHNMPYRDESELHRITATLVNAARSSGCHLLLVCHLNQERAKEEILPRPVIRDLRGSGMISKLAATVLSLHRAQRRNTLGFVETDMLGTIVAEKARHGHRGDGIEVVFMPQRMRFRLPTSTDAKAAA